MASVLSTRQCAIAALVVLLMLLAGLPYPLNPARAQSAPTISLDPTEGPPGTAVTIQGSGWVSGDTVILWFAVNLEADGASTESTVWYDIGQATVGDDGTFVSTFTVPAEATDSGAQGVSVDTSEASEQAVAFFQVVPQQGETPPPDAEPTATLDPAEGPPGTAVTVTGSGWPPGDTIAVWWDTKLAETTADSDGNIQVSFIVPPDAAAGEYDVDIRDAEPGMGGIDVRLTFRVVPPEKSSPPLNPQVKELQFYESGPGELPNEQQVYDHRFASETSRYINWVLDLEYSAPGSPVDYKITAIYLRDSGAGSWEEMHRHTVDAHVEGDQTWSSHWSGYGADNPGSWAIGSYRVDIYFEGLGSDGQLIASEQFEIYGTADTEPPTVSWVKPVGNREYYPTLSGTVELEVSVTDNADIRLVEFVWWNTVSSQFVGITTDSSPPYQASIEISSLNMKWNQITAVAEDTAGNRAEEPIMIYRLMPAITLDPTEGSQSGVVTVEGSGWFPGDTVIISLGQAANEVTQATVDSEGNFEKTFTVPANAVIGEQKVLAITANGFWQTDANFLVTEPEETPTPTLAPPATPTATPTPAPTPSPPSASICGQASPATGSTPGSNTIFSPVLVPFSNAPVVRWDPPGFAQDAFYRIKDPQIAPLDPPFESQEYGPIKHKIVSWSSFEQIDDPAACGTLPPPETFIDYFALGDSIASGHGLMDEGVCRRSTLAYPRKVVDYLATRYTMRRQEILACSGATAARDPQSDNQLMRFHNQVQVVVDYLDKNGSDRPTLVSITIGANDFEFDDPGKVLDHLEETPEDYNAWLEEVINHPQTGVKKSVKDAVVSLLAKPNVMVIITDYHNPFNKDGIMFQHQFWLSELERNLKCVLEECYQRTQLAILQLNGAFIEIWQEIGRDLGQSVQSRLQITSVKAKFDADGGHESPRGTDSNPFSQCGRALPDTNTTWIQYPSDRDSNSYPFQNQLLENLFKDTGLKLLLTGLNGGQPWRGDCFHPNNEGAQAYADAVIEDLRRVGR